MSITSPSNGSAVSPVPGGGGHVSVVITGAANADVLTAQVVTATPSGGTSYGYTWVATDPAGRDRSSQTLSATNIAAPTFTPEGTSGNWALKVTVTSGSDSAIQTANVRIGDDEGWIRLQENDFTWVVTNSIITAHTQQGDAIRLTIADTQSRTAAQADYGHYVLPSETDGFLCGSKIEFANVNDGSERWAALGFYYNPAAPVTHGSAVGLNKNSASASPAARMKHLFQNSQTEDNTDRATAFKATCNISMNLSGIVTRSEMILLDASNIELESATNTDEQDVTLGNYFVTLYAGKQDAGGGSGDIDVTPFFRRYAVG